MGEHWGTIDAAGNYLAAQVPGNYFVKAIGANGVTSSVKLIIEKVTVSKIDLNPKGVILAPGQIQKFNVEVYDIHGRLVNIPPLWTATGGILQADGTYRAGNIMGRYGLKVTVGNFSIETSIVIKKPGKPFMIKLSPDVVTLKPGENIAFHAEAFDKGGLKVPGKLRWRASGGKITDGVYTAGNQEGVFEVMAMLAKAKKKSHYNHIQE